MAAMATDAYRFYDVKNLLAEQREAGESWLEFLRVPSLRTGLYVLKPGEWDHQTPHEEDEVYYVVTGRARFETGDATREVGAGSVIYVAAHQPHRFTDIEEELQIVVFFAAPR